jgi:hypothetical protein
MKLDFRPVIAFAVLIGGMLQLVGTRFLPLDFLADLTAGWAPYCGRVIPQLRPNFSAVLPALICLAFLAVGFHQFLGWFHRQTSAIKQVEGESPRGWLIRWSVTIVAIVMLMFTAGISALGVSHQTAWLLTAPEPLTEGGIDEVAALYKSQQNLRQIAVGMHQYAENKGILPAAAIWDAKGRPLLSWRVTLLPFIEESALYKEFHLNEPWDSPHNLQLLPRMPKLYATPSYRESPSNANTHYRVFTGKGTAFEGQTGLRLASDFPDGVKNTILIVESHESVPWTKPEGLPFDPSLPLPRLGYLSPKCFIAVNADGGSYKIKHSMSDATIRALITRNGGEKVEEDW